MKPRYWMTLCVPLLLLAACGKQPPPNKPPLPKTGDSATLLPAQRALNTAKGTQAVTDRHAREEQKAIERATH